MTYSFFVIICLIIHAIISVDLFRRKSSEAFPAIKQYRVFAISLGVYLIVDVLWGVFEEHKLSYALYIDTVIYFVLMGFTILAFSLFVTEYLKGHKWVGRGLMYFGNVFFAAEIVLLIINFFHPILFEVDMETCVYTSHKARNIMLYVQILVYLLLFAYTLVYSIIKRTALSRKYITICIYSLFMSSAIVAQIFDPYLPFYSAGCIIGFVMLNSFTINDIKEEFKTALDQSQAEVVQSHIALDQTIHIAYTDPLTGIKNKHAYVEEEERIDRLVGSHQMGDFAVIVFDLNGLKHVNDTKGHDAGDAYIIEAVKTIERFFEGETLYRFGGDEFVLILEGEGFKNRQKMLSDFESFIDGCLGQEGAPIISSGMSRYRPGQDNTYHAVFNRADKIMYARKDTLKEHHSA